MPIQVVPLLLPFDVAGLGLLREQVQAFMAGIEVDARRRVHLRATHRLEELHRLGDRIQNLLIRILERRVSHETEIPIFGMMQIGEPAVDQRADKVERERGALVAAQQEFGIGLALQGAEPRTIDVVASVAWQRHSVPSLGIRRARLCVLAREAPHAKDGLLQALQEHEAHLQQDLQSPCDIVGLAILEALGAIAALKQKLLAALRGCELRVQLLHLPGDDEGGQPTQGSDRALESHRIAVLRLLSGRTALPACRMPVRQLQSLGHRREMLQNAAPINKLKELPCRKPATRFASSSSVSRILAPGRAVMVGALASPVRSSSR
jgi:hypothetical protein